MDKQTKTTNTPPTQHSKQNRLSKLLSLALYLIPVIFFTVCYFLIITSGEDIYQGANTAPDIIGDAIDAYRYNSRLSDMYAWSVINFFDYRFSFGVDTVFRLADVIMATAIIYIMTYFSLGHRPRLNVSDASWFLFCFILIFATPHGRTLYAGFSIIHNYLIITLSTLIFLIPFIKLINGKSALVSRHSNFAMLILGFVFGFSSNITPIAFVISYLIIRGYLYWQHKLKPNRWEIMGLIGIAIGISLQYLFGSGINAYINSDYTTNYDYVSFSEIIQNPFNSLSRLATHVVRNFARVFIPLAGVPLLAAACITMLNKIGGRKTNLFYLAENRKNYLFIALFFIVIHLAIMSQINYPLRLALPAYVIGVTTSAIIVRSWLDQTNFRIQIAFTVVLTIFSLAILTTRTAYAINYIGKTAPIFEYIKTYSGNSLCIPIESVDSLTMPVIYLGQEPMLVDWAMPQVIYGKSITFCQ